MENRMLKDKLIQLKSTVSVLREEKYAGQKAGAPQRDEKTRSRDRGEKSREKSKDRKK